jgi:hypothetical protein
MRQMTKGEFDKLLAKGEAVLERNPPFKVDYPIYRLKDGSLAVRTGSGVMVFEPADQAPPPAPVVPPVARPGDLLGPGFIERVGEARERVWERLGVRTSPLTGAPSLEELERLDRVMRRRKAPVDGALLESLVAVLGEALRGKQGKWELRKMPYGRPMPVVIVKGKEWYPLDETLDQLDNQKEFTFAGILQYAEVSRKKKGLFGP